MVGAKYETLGSLAQAAIAKYLKQATRREDAVLADTDPEELHQMRVAMRRLRTALQVFQPGITIPKAGKEPRVADVARQLGELRDLDVIEETLRQRFLPELPQAEQTALETAFTALARRRVRVFKQVKQLLEGEKYRQLKKGLKGWLKQPDLDAIAALPAATAMPDLVLPLVSRLWLHPGWLIGTTETLEIDTQLDPAAVDELIDQNSEPLHSLRKQIKRVRYQLKLIEDLYGDALTAELDNLEAMQETLGQLQDSMILADFLEEAIPDARNQIPSLFSQLADNRYKAWQQWQSLQQTYLDPAMRHHLRLVLLTPEAPGAEPPAKVEKDSKVEAPPETENPAAAVQERPEPTEQSNTVAPQRPVTATAQPTQAKIDAKGGKTTFKTMLKAKGKRQKTKGMGQQG
ncbi:CHAD domain-containing protein [Pseudanabaena sp. FACHB-2040]|uniref:CHAD domain-containing protein n=1 Tax=Pseudanabaena sp. FACHB-2040 TaxID=2692859 RepID=UPI001681CD42|nr:CHAD domain-containing protein [Pseudanabaena sp. FACHB-2040]MBD2258661.1 CHAD domain-containing protein [Pseudanabaena sp. FACHB-2040]